MPKTPFLVYLNYKIIDNKNYWVARNAELAHSRNTEILTPIFKLMNELIN